MELEGEDWIFLAWDVSKKFTIFHSFISQRVNIQTLQIIKNFSSSTFEFS